MENRRVFTVESHYLVEIDKVKPFGSMGTMTETISWDIYIASDGKTEYRGKALASNRSDLDIPWTTLKEMQPLEEMVKICERQMERL